MKNVSRPDSEDLTDRGRQGHRVTSDLWLSIGRREARLLAGRHGRLVAHLAVDGGGRMTQELAEQGGGRRYQCRLGPYSGVAQTSA